VLIPAVLPAQDDLPPATGAARAQDNPADQPAPDKPAAARPTAPTLADVVEKLSPGNRRKFGEMLGADWKERPEWADMLIALLQGGGMGPGAGWFKPSAKKYDWNWLADHFDVDGNGTISPEELPAEAPFADLLFARLDRDNDRQLRPADFDYVGRQQNTPPLFMSQFLTSFFDSDSNGRITREELEAFLKRADVDKTGFITSDDLYRDFSKIFFEEQNGGSGGSDMPRPEKMLPMFFRGEFGVLEAGPTLGDAAPDFTLPTHDGTRQVTLSQSRGKPVILIFGSFT
jgi:Ca2+-binding EF-hand superfamily protein